MAKSKFYETLKSLREAIENDSQELNQDVEYSDDVVNFVNQFVRLVEDVMNSDPDIAAIVESTLGVEAIQYWKKFESDHKSIFNKKPVDELKKWLLKVHEDLSAVFEAVNTSDNSDDYVALDQITSEVFGKDPDSTLEFIADQLNDPQFS